MPSKVKGKGGKKHRRAKNVIVTDYVELPDQDQYFGFVTKILGSGRVTLNYFKEKINDKTKSSHFCSTVSNKSWWYLRDVQNNSACRKK